VSSETTKAYQSPGITVSFDSSLCRHGGACARGLPEVFHPRVRPWITPTEATPERVAAQVRRCPSGALQYVLTSTAEA
jgi:uncharacterized Fe-S cluster protein YjdI